MASSSVASRRSRCKLGRQVADDVVVWWTTHATEATDAGTKRQAGSSLRRRQARDGCRRNGACAWRRTKRCVRRNLQRTIAKMTMPRNAPGNVMELQSRAARADSVSSSIRPFLRLSFPSSTCASYFHLASQNSAPALEASDSRIRSALVAVRTRSPHVDSNCWQVERVASTRPCFARRWNARRDAPCAHVDTWWLGTAF